MATVFKVTLSLNTTTGFVEASPNVVTLDKDEQVVFVTDDNYVYTVLIYSYSIYFNSSRIVFIRDVDLDRSVLTNDTKPNSPTPTDGHPYTVICSTQDNAYTTDPDAPPKIIVKNHQ